MTSVLIIAHGSRRPAANQNLKKLAKQVAFLLPMNVDDVQIGFLELAHPSVPVCIDDMFYKGAEQLLILPYFLTQGNHVSKDIPTLIAKCKNKWPTRKISVLPHIGALEEMSTLIAKRCIEELMKHHKTPTISGSHYYELGVSP